jgi:hypothetical chaperone protein
VSELSVGIDFGTTNSALAIVDAQGEPQLEGPLRSIVQFDPERREPTGRLIPAVGPDAVEAWLDTRADGRLIQSAKSFLASKLFLSTNVFGTTFSLETFVAYILRALRVRAEARFGAIPARAVVGRPVSFAGAAARADEDLALRRLTSALAEAGFGEVRFEYEPVAAAWHFEHTLDADALVLIGDFGGGTSDFSLVRVGPGERARHRRSESILGSAGVALAGDAFDGKLVRHLVAPRLGRGDTFRSPFGQVLPVPTWLYGHLERWNHVSFLRSRDTLRILYDLQRDAVDPGPLAALLHLVENDLGFELYRAVQVTKEALSTADEARFHFRDGPLVIDVPVARRDFEAWIGDELETIARCVDGLLARTGVSPADVDRVFLTGGSSLMPAVRRPFEERFGDARIATGSEFTSVARGLALAAAS